MLSYLFFKKSFQNIMRGHFIAELADMNNSLRNSTIHVSVDVIQLFNEF